MCDRPHRQVRAVVEAAGFEADSPQAVVSDDQHRAVAPRCGAPYPAATAPCTKLALQPHARTTLQDCDHPDHRGDRNLKLDDGTEPQRRRPLERRVVHHPNTPSSVARSARGPLCSERRSGRPRFGLIVNWNSRTGRSDNCPMFGSSLLRAWKGPTDERSPRHGPGRHGVVTCDHAVPPYGRRLRPRADRS